MVLSHVQEASEFWQSMEAMRQEIFCISISQKCEITMKCFVFMLQQ